MRPIILVLLLLSAATNQTASFSNLFMLNTVVKFRSCSRHPVLLMHASEFSTQSNDVNDNEEASGEKPISDKSHSRSKGFKTHTSMRTKNLLIIGLGNPGTDYDSTRHNIGFRILDEFAASKKTTMKFSSKFNADYGAVRIGDKNVGLLKPGTYINNSGGPIKKIMENFKLLPKDILIVADDIALDCGVLRLREKGSHGGHNGHRDIEAALKTKEYTRLRVGISGPGRKDLVEHVLGEFSQNERDLISLAATQSCATIEDWILTDESQLVINRCNAQHAK